MKLLLINYMETTAPGGINKVVFEIARWLSKWGHEVVVFNPAWEDNLQMREEKIEGFKLIRGYKYGESLYGLSIKNVEVIREIIRKFNPDVIHIHGYHTLFSPEAIWAIRRIDKKIPIVFSPHYGPYGHNTLAGRKVSWDIYNKLVGEKIFKKVDSIIVASNFEKLHLLKAVSNVNPQKVIVIPHGVDLMDLSNKRRDNTGEIHLLFAGYLLKLKGVQYIIQALAELVYTFNIKNIKLTIVGDGPYKANLKTLAKKLKVEDYIVWKPFLNHSKLLTEIKKADIFLLLSENENYGITVAEALALGTPVIVTKRTALKEFLSEPGCFGVDYPPNPKEVAELILKIVNSDVKVGPFSKKIRTWEEVVRDYEKIYGRLIRN